MTHNEFDLFSRGNEFDRLIKNTICTNLHEEQQNIETSFSYLAQLFNNNKEDGGAIYVIGNGGSAAVAAHAVTDLVNACHLRAFTLHESSLITCMANDFGYEHSFKHIIHSVFKKNDILIAISSSGKSPNIHNAVRMAKEVGGVVVTLSGFSHDNPLRTMGDFNFWLNASDYGLVEIGHLFLLHNLADRIAITIKKEVKIDYSIATLLSNTA